MDVTAYNDVLTGQALVYTGFSGLDENDDEYSRPYRLILNGMLLQIQVRILDVKKMLRKNGVSEHIIKTCEEPHRPDLAYVYSYEEFPPFTEKQLRRYMWRFADKVIPHLDLEQESVDYIRENLNDVIDYLAEKLADGSLRFFKHRVRVGPEDGAAIAFGDFSDPHMPIFTYPAFGLMAKTCDDGYVPWKPRHLRKRKRKVWVVEPVIDQKSKEKYRRLKRQRKKSKANR